MKYKARVHSARGKSLLAICDKELAGEVFSEGKAQLDLSTGFYDGEPMSAESFKTRINEFDQINMVGNSIIKLAKELKLIKADQIITIAGIQHAQVINIKTE